LGDDIHERFAVRDRTAPWALARRCELHVVRIDHRTLGVIVCRHLPTTGVAHPAAFAYYCVFAQATDVGTNHSVPHR
jgi:hypothetical protein